MEDGKDFKTLAEVAPCTSNALGWSLPLEILTLTYGIRPPCPDDPIALPDSPNKDLEQGTLAATPSVAATAGISGAWCGGVFDCCSGAGSTQCVAKSDSDTTMSSGVGGSLSRCTSKVGFGSPEIIEFID